ncbi:hypothetical protein CCE11_15290 [Escherichia coli]|nr:hypothetical protein CCE11_15290 [Escherichia coli]
MLCTVYAYSTLHHVLQSIYLVKNLTLNTTEKLTRTQKVLYRVKSGYFATQLKPARQRVF